MEQSSEFRFGHIELDLLMGPLLEVSRKKIGFVGLELKKETCSGLIERNSAEFSVNANI